MKADGQGTVCQPPLFLLLADFRKIKGTGSEAMRTEGQGAVGQPPLLPPLSRVQKEIRHGKRGREG